MSTFRIFGNMNHIKTFDERQQNSINSELKQNKNVQPTFIFVPSKYTNS